MTLSNYVGDTRSNAIWRIAFLAINLATGFVLLGAVFAIGWLFAAGFMLIDVVTGLILDEDASFGESIAMALWSWPIDMVGWLAFGDRDFPFLPDF